jgi:hypothetical protein
LTKSSTVVRADFCGRRNVPHYLASELAEAILFTLGDALDLVDVGIVLLHQDQRVRVVNLRAAEICAFRLRCGHRTDPTRDPRPGQDRRVVPGGTLRRPSVAVLQATNRRIDEVVANADAALYAEPVITARLAATI